MNQRFAVLRCGWIPLARGFRYSVWVIDPSPIRERFAALSPHLSERERRLFAASEARAAGYGGIASVAAATGIAASTIGRGLKELAAEDRLAAGRVRRPGADARRW